MVPPSVSISAWSGIGNLLGQSGKTSMFCFFWFFIFAFPQYSPCVAQQPFAKRLDWLWSVYMTRSFPLARRADGGKKSRMTVKIFPYRLHRNPHRFLRSCGIRKTSLRQRLHSTATLFDCFQYIRNGRSSQGIKRKSVRVRRKLTEGLVSILGVSQTPFQNLIFLWCCSNYDKQILHSILISNQSYSCLFIVISWFPYSNPL